MASNLIAMGYGLHPNMASHLIAMGCHTIAVASHLIAMASHLIAMIQVKCLVQAWAIDILLKCHFVDPLMDAGATFWCT